MRRTTPLPSRAKAAALTVVVPGDLDTRTGGYGYDRRIVAGLRDRGWLVDVRRLDGSFPVPTPAARAHAAEVLAAIPDGSLVLVDGLALGALPAEAEREAARLKIVALVHHPLAAETGIDPALAAALEISERRALAASCAIIATSRATAARLADYGVPPDRIAVVEPGTDPAPLARGSAFRSPLSAFGKEPSRLRSHDNPASYGEARQRAEGATAAPLNPQPSVDSPVPSPRPREISLLCVATLTPRKGYELLMSALAKIPQRHWRLTCAGSLDRDAETVARVRAQVREHGLEDRVWLAGELDAATLATHYDGADLFVLPTLYEGYGMVVAEALARGLPVVSTATGAIEYLVLGVSSAGSVRLPASAPAVVDGAPARPGGSAGRTGRPPDHAAGIVVEPGDLQAFSDALSRVIGDPQLLAQLAAGARRRRDRLPTWEAAAAAMARALEREAKA